jgi:hypothetical protein
MTGVIMTGVNMTGVIMTGVIMTSVIMTGVIMLSVMMSFLHLKTNAGSHFLFSYAVLRNVTRHCTLQEAV